MSSGWSPLLQPGQETANSKGQHLLYMYNIITSLSNIETMYANWWIPLASIKTLLYCSGASPQRTHWNLKLQSQSLYRPLSEHSVSLSIHRTSNLCFGGPGMFQPCSQATPRFYLSVVEKTPLLQDKIWEWPGNEARNVSHVKYSEQGPQWSGSYIAIPEAEYY